MFISTPEKILRPGILQNIAFTGLNIVRNLNIYFNCLHYLLLLLYFNR